MTGRAPATLERVLDYLEVHAPCTIAQVCRATRADRRYVQRIVRALEKFSQTKLTACPGAKNDDI